MTLLFSLYYYQWPFDQGSKNAIEYKLYTKRIEGIFLRKKALTLQFTSWIFLLTTIAGFMNVTVIILFSTTSSHHTGNLSHSMMSLLEGNYLEALHLLLILLSFFFGSMLSGFLFPEQTFKLTRRYGYIQLISAGLIAVGSSFLINPLWYSLGAALILGLQNGMFVFYKGMIVRTTHMSGNLTDAGLAIGRCLAGRPSQLWKARFQLMNIFFYVFGSFIGADLLLRTQVNIWLVASGLYLISGILYFLLFHHVNYIRIRNKQLTLNEQFLFDFLIK